MVSVSVLVFNVDVGGSVGVGDCVGVGVTVSASVGVCVGVGTLVTYLCLCRCWYLCCCWCTLQIILCVDPLFVGSKTCCEKYVTTRISALNNCKLSRY